MTWRWATQILIRVVQYTKSGYSVGIAKPKTRSIWSESYVISPLPWTSLWFTWEFGPFPLFKWPKHLNGFYYTLFPGANKKRNLSILSSWWFQPIWKILVNLAHFCRDRGENKNYLSCHHPVISWQFCHCDMHLEGWWKRDLQNWRIKKGPFESPGLTNSSHPWMNVNTLLNIE